MNRAIVIGVASIVLALSDAAFLPGVLPHNEIECHCYADAATVSPVCGTDGRSYDNMCIFACYKKNNEDLELKHKGECMNTSDETEDSSESCYCTKEINLVCGTDGKTYKNTCFLNCQARDTKDLKLKHHGTCEDSQLTVASNDAPLLDCPCTKELNLVCGSDAKTYLNFCILSCHSSLFKDLKLKHHGACEGFAGDKNSEPEIEECFCSKEINHVCGTDSKTYQNFCLLNCRSRNTKDLKLKHHGACERFTGKKHSEPEIEECFCSKEINHVCGTDSKTYQNICLLNCRSRNTKDLKLKHHGECKAFEMGSTRNKHSADCFCSKEINHVCGTDSKTYQNLCLLSCHSRNAKDLKLAYVGHCNGKSPIIMN